MAQPPSYPPQPQLILLKARSTPEDKYESYLHALHAPGPLFIPPLTSIFNDPNITRLAATLSTPYQLFASYAALVITSQRGVDGLRQALQKRLTDPGDALPLEFILPYPIFVVGPATAAATRSVCAEFAFTADVKGEESGSGARLARFILETYGEEKPLNQSLLHVVGEKRDHALKTVLGQAGVSLEEITVYDTAANAEFGARLQEGLEKVDEVEIERTGMGGGAGGGGAGAATRWIVVFAPSGVRLLLETLGWLGSDGMFDRALQSKEESGIERRPGKNVRTKVIAMGPTTQRHALDDWGFEVDAVAPRPTPEGVWEAVQEVLKKG